MEIKYLALNFHFFCSQGLPLLTVFACPRIRAEEWPAAVPLRASIPADPGGRAAGRFAVTAPWVVLGGLRPRRWAALLGLLSLALPVPLCACPGLGLPRTAGFSLTLDN